MLKKKNSITKKFILLLKSLKEYRKESIWTPILVSVEVVFEVLIPLVMAEMIDQMTGNTIDPIIKYGIALILMALLSLAAGIFAGKFGATASSGFAKNLRKDMYYKIQDYSFAEIDMFSSSSLVTRLTTDVSNVQNAYQMIIRIAVRTPLMMIFAFIMSLSISWQMGIIFVVVIPILGGGLAIILTKAFPIFKRIFKKYDDLNNNVQENVNGIRTVKSFVRDEFEIKKFDQAANEVKNDFTLAEKIIALNNPLMIFSMYLITILISYFGATMIINSSGLDLTTGELSSLITYSTMVLMSVMLFSMVFVMISIATESIERVAEIIMTDSSLDPNVNGLNIVKDGTVEFRSVSFKYSEEGKYVLDNINIKIKSGDTIGILGVTGSSKTSLVQLIPRLYDVTVGEVIVGHKNVKEYNVHSLREEVAVVLQKNVLFSGTIAENLRWGNKNASIDEIKEAAKLACADEFIEQLPDKYDTYIERGGTNVSGGQKQRLCIARALLKKPKIIIFDDSTSAVDTKTDAKIRTALQKSLPNTTKIIIAQRVDSVKNADKIAVLESGKIVAFDSHDHLIKSSHLYRETYESQTKGQRSE